MKPLIISLLATGLIVPAALAQNTKPAAQPGGLASPSPLAPPATEKGAAVGGFGQATMPATSAVKIDRAQRPGASMFAVGGTRGSSDAIPPLVIEFSSTNQTVVQEWEEDLAVMTHIIEQALQRAGEDESPDVKLGLPLLVTSSRSVRPLYVEGFGALFMIKVNFPLLPPSKIEDEKGKRNDSDWERAKQEMYGRGWPATGGTETGADYDPDQVDELKKELMQALKNAANIRHLKPEEYVSITVFGSPNTVAKTKVRRKNKADAGDAVAKDVERMIQNQLNPSRASRPGTVLTMRVKASDINSYADGKLDFEDFQKKVVLNSYLGSGYGITSLNSWIRGALQDFGVVK